MRKSIFLILILGFTPTLSWAQALSTFSSGDTISASAINGNFSSLNTAIGSKLSTPAGGSNGQVLTTDGSGNYSWTTVAGGGGISSLLNGTAGSSPNWTSVGGTYTLNLPLASTGFVSAGLISNSDYNNFNGKISKPAAPTTNQVLYYNGTAWINGSLSYTYAPSISATPSFTNGGLNTTLNMPMASNATTTAGLVSNTDYVGWVRNGGNTTGTGQNLSIGTTNGNKVDFKTQNIARMTIDTSGYVGIGTSTPVGLLDVSTTASNTSSSPNVKLSAPLSGTGLIQVHTAVNSNISQSSSAGYVVLNVNANDSSSTASGPRKLLELSTNNTPQFSVNAKGYVEVPGFIGTHSSGISVSGSSPSFTAMSGTSVSYSTYDVGTSGTVTPSFNGELYYIYLSYSYSGNGTPYVIASDGTNFFEVPQGVHLKRLNSTGTWQFKLGCVTATTCSGTFSPGSTLGMRRFF